MRVSTGMSMERREKKTDWFKIVVHFFCGALLGATFGLRLAAPGEWKSGWTVLLVILSPSIVVGLLSAVYLDRFWEMIQGYLRLFRSKHSMLHGFNSQGRADRRNVKKPKGKEKNSNKLLSLV